LNRAAINAPIAVSPKILLDKGFKYFSGGKIIEALKKLKIEVEF
jgi:hypothetical protein